MMRLGRLSGPPAQSAFVERRTVFIRAAWPHDYTNDRYAAGLDSVTVYRDTEDTKDTPTSRGTLYR